MTTSPLSAHGAPGTVTAHSQGGLGNQLFIYAAGLAAARAQGCALRMDDSLHRQARARPYELARLGLPAVHDTVSLPVDPFWRRRVPGARRGIPHGCTFREPSFRYDHSVLDTAPGGCVFGYYQSWRYVEAVADDLRGSLNQLAERLSAPAKENKQRLIENVRGITLHVRRGDYLDPAGRAFHGLAGKTYYLRAVTTLRAMGFDGPLSVFSDDPSLAAEELTSVGDVQILSVSGAPAWEELIVMSAAAALVTANSSFSWWAGWLGDHADRPVISPRPWFDTVEHDSRDLLPAHWLTLERRP